MSTRLLSALAALALTLSLAPAAPAWAGNSTSLGHGVKCTWVLVSSVGGVNTYKQVCRKGV
ncbi:MAG: hypothetical protein U1F56_04610 [Rubrivivax sp.]